MVRHLHFSAVRLSRLIDEIPAEQSMEFGYFLKFGGSRAQVTAYLKNSEKLIYDSEAQKWKRRSDVCFTAYNAE